MFRLGGGQCEYRTMYGCFRNSVWMITYRAAANNGLCRLQQVLGRGKGGGERPNEKEMRVGRPGGGEGGGQGGQERANEK